MATTMSRKIIEPNGYISIHKEQTRRFVLTIRKPVCLPFDMKLFF